MFVCLELDVFTNNIILYLFLCILLPLFRLHPVTKSSVDIHSSSYSCSLKPFVFRFGARRGRFVVPRQPEWSPAACVVSVDANSFDFVFCLFACLVVLRLRMFVRLSTSRAEHPSWAGGVTVVGSPYCEH